MRTVILAIAALAVVEFTPRPSEAAIYYPWCAEYGTRSAGSYDCSYVTKSQCMATVPVNEGHCFQNPKPPSAYEGSAVPPQPSQQRRPPR